VDCQKMRMAVLDESWKLADGKTLIEDEDIAALKHAVKALADGNAEAAAIEAGSTPISLKVWEAALKAADNN